MVAQDHRVLVAEIGDEPLALVEVDRDALIIVDRRPRRGSASRSGSAAAAPRHGPTPPGRAGVWRCITACASSRAMWIAEWMVKPAGLVMNGVGSTGLPSMSTLTRLEAVTSSNIRLYGIEQEMMLGPRDPRRQMGEDEVVPAIMRDQPVGGGEIDPDLPFLVADLALRATGSRPTASGFALAHPAVDARRRGSCAASSWPVGMGGGERARARSHSRRRGRSVG